MSKNLLNSRSQSGHVAAGLRMSTLAVAVLVITAGCDGLLDVDLPGDMTDTDLLQPDQASLMVDAAIAAFECDFSTYSATITGMEDATWVAGGYWGSIPNYATERVSLTAAGVSGTIYCSNRPDFAQNWYMDFQGSHLLARMAYEQLSEAWTEADVPNRERLMATAATYIGLYYVTLGEIFCEFSPNSGPLLSPREMMAQAEGWFTTALNHVANTGDFSIVSTESILQLALLGRARARLNMEDHQGASADAAEIQPGFVAWVTRDSSVRSRWNTVYHGLNQMQWRSFQPALVWSHTGEVVSAGYKYLTISEDGRQTISDGMPDPRVPVEYVGGVGIDPSIDQYNQFKYTGLGADQRLGSWAEAQLILAEIEGGQSAVDRINALRDIHGLPHFSSTDEDEIYSAMIEERRREFFLEGKHFADKLRLGLWFPRGRGENWRGEAFGYALCWLMPISEYENNENIAAGYEGPDLTDPNYVFDLRVDRIADWPVYFN